MTHTTQTTASRAFGKIALGQLALGKIAALLALTAGIALSSAPAFAAQAFAAQAHAAQAFASASASTHGAQTTHTRLASTAPATPAAPIVLDSQDSSPERRGGLQQVDYSREQIIARLNYINAKMAEMEPVARHASSRASYYRTTDSWSQSSYWSAYASSLWRNLAQLSVERIQLQRMLQ